MSAKLLRFADYSRCPYEDQIMEYLESHPFVTNKIARSITGEGSENRIKNIFKKLREAGKIRILDPNARKFEYKYVLKG